MVAKGEGGEGGKDWECGISRCKLLYNRINNKVLLCSTGNYSQYPVINHTGKKYLKKKNVYMCITDSLCCTADWHIVNQLYFNKKIKLKKEYFPKFLLVCVL